MNQTNRKMLRRMSMNWDEMRLDTVPGAESMETFSCS